MTPKLRHVLGKESEVKTADLNDVSLAYAVSLLENPEWGDGGHIANVTCPDDLTGWVYRPDINSAQGHPIIEREKIELIPVGAGWLARHHFKSQDEFGTRLSMVGPTALIAALRCYVAAELGDEVKIPAELVRGRSGIKTKSTLRSLVAS